MAIEDKVEGEASKERFESIPKTETQKKAEALELKIQRKLAALSKQMNYHRSKTIELQKQAFMYEDPLGYYRRFHNGVSKGKLCKINQPLYRLLHDKGIQIPGERRSFKSNEERMGYYQNVHPGKERGQLFAEDPTFYEILMRHDLLKNIPPFDADEPYPFEADPVNYYLQHFSDLTRTQLKKTKGLRPLYEKLKQMNKLDICAKSENGRKFASDKDRIAYFKKEHLGKTLGQLYSDDKPFYENLRRHGLLRKLFPSFIPNDSDDFGGDPVAYYLKHYAGLTQTQLKKSPNGNRRLHRRLAKDGKLDICAKPKRNKNS